MYWHTLPELKWLVVILAMVLLCCRCKGLNWTLGLCLASAVSLVQSHIFVRDVNTLFNCAGNITINIQLNSTFRTNLYFSNSVVEVLEVQGCDAPVSGQLLLKVPIELAHQMQLGETWQVSAKIKPIIGLLNEAGFDAEKHYFSQRVIAQGKVLEVIKKIESPNLRGRWFAQIYQQTQQLESQPLLLALLFGERSFIDKEQWQDLKRTGLAHLIAISGLHIGLAYAVGWWVGHLIRIAVPSGMWLPLLSAVTMAVFYAWLAGFSLPTQRALVMCVIGSAALLLGLRWSRWQVLWLTLAIVLSMSPMSALSSSLWLSVGAVVVIILALESLTQWPPAPARHQSSEIKSLPIHSPPRPQRTGSALLSALHQKWRAWLRVQLFLSLGLAPICAWFLGGVAWLSMLFNAMAIPLVSLYVVPLLLAGIMLNEVSHSLAMLLFGLADRGLVLLQDVVAFSQGYTLLWWQATRTQIGLMVLLFCLVCLRKKLRVVVASMSVMVLVAVEFYAYSPQWRLDVLDVGHGLAVLIRSNNRAVLYDTGAHWGDSGMAELVVEPVIRNKGTQLDALFISHWDNDHQGGMEYLLRRFLPKEVFSSQRDGQTSPCIQGQFWWWQGLSFQMVWPPQQVRRAYNPHSCVIRISDGQHSVLLTGDIDAVAEYQLAHMSLQSDVVIVPHHGSNTSSTMPFVRNTAADWAIASVAKQGRWSLPSHKVIHRYQHMRSKWLDTGEKGQVSVYFLDSELKIVTLRSPQTDAWYRKILRNRVE
ncbi:DNA internalization-related competence protein ComEC/Rec2 [Vibrio rarus]